MAKALRIHCLGFEEGEEASGGIGGEDGIARYGNWGKKE